MKRFYLLVLVASFTFNSMAAGYYGHSSLDLPGWLTFIGIIMIVWGILEIILFFKIWGMTNDIKSLKKSHFFETSFDNTYEKVEYLNRNVILDNNQVVKRILILSFMEEVETSFEKLPKEGTYTDENGKEKWGSFKEKNLKASIEIHKDKLNKQLDKIGEELPSVIKQMETYYDYYNIFEMKDFIN